MRYSWQARQSSGAASWNAATERTTLAYGEPSGTRERPASKTERRALDGSAEASASGVGKAAAMHAAMNRAPFTPSPSCDTLAAVAAYSAALSGRPGHTRPQVSMNICPPICSATVRPLRAIEPDSGAGMPAFRLR